MDAAPYRPLTAADLPARLGPLPALRALLGPDPSAWTAAEVGDGNLNLVFVVTGPAGRAVAKQALPYVRLVGDSWPLPLERSWFEWNALTRHAARDPGSVPAVHHFDRAQALIVMDHIPGVILRRSLIAGAEHPGVGAFLGKFAARTLFRSSDLSMPTAQRKADLALFAANTALLDITEALVFTDPYFAAPLNRHTAPHLDALVAEIRADARLKIEAQHLKFAFASNAEALLHGDLHTGSIMAEGAQIAVIDPEFAGYGPMGFDVGMLIANFLMAFHAQSGHEPATGVRDPYRAWILGVAAGVWDAFAAEFAHLWRTERRGMLYPAALYEDQNQPEAAEAALADRLAAIWTDALGFMGVEIHRRILGLAHNADFETIGDPERRAACEAPALRLGRSLVLDRRTIPDMAAVCALARAEDARSPGR